MTKSMTTSPPGTNPTVQHKIYANLGNESVLAVVPKNAKTVLDVGCGAGDNASRLHARGYIVDGVTLSEAEAAVARQFCRRVLIYNLEDGLPPELDATYDVVICSHVLEHICWPQALLSDIRRKLTSPSSRALIALPNIMGWRYRMPLVLGRFEYTETGTMDETHFRWYTFKSAQALFQKHGFTIRRAWVDSFFPLFMLRKLLPRPLVRRIDALSGKLSPGLFGLQMLFEISARENSQGPV